MNVNLSNATFYSTSAPLTDIKENITPEQIDNINNALTEKKESYKQDVIDKAHFAYQADLATSYVNNQKNVVNAYTRSANGEAAYETSSETDLSLTQQYMNLVSTQIQVLSDRNNVPSINPIDETEAPIGKPLENNQQLVKQNLISQYQENKGQPPKSYLELTV